MRWNWQLPDWPNFGWDSRILAPAEDIYLRTGGAITGLQCGIESNVLDALRVDAMAEGAAATSAIEGEQLQIASIRSSMRRALGLPGSRKSKATAEDAVAKLTADVYLHFSEPLTHVSLHRMHQMLFSGK